MASDALEFKSRQTNSKAWVLKKYTTTYTSIITLIKLTCNIFVGILLSPSRLSSVRAGFVSHPCISNSRMSALIQYSQDEKIFLSLHNSGAMQ